MNKTTNNTKIDNVRSGYTTGQWSIQENSANRNLRVIDNAKRIVADCYSFSEAIPQLEAEANAKLIASAPILLDAAILCESITDRCNNAMLPKHIQVLLSSINETLKEAINKATL